MSTIIIIALLCAVGYYAWKKVSIKFKQYEPEDFPVIIDKTLSHTTDTEGKLSRFSTTVAGISHHSYSSIKSGIIVGYSKPEPNNIHDSRAVVLKSWHGRKLGYISRDDQIDFQIFSKRNRNLAFVCHIKPFGGQYSSNMGDIVLFSGDIDKIRDAINHELQKAHSSNIPVLA